jgi:hypothetical protein
MESEIQKIIPEIRKSFLFCSEAAPEKQNYFIL